MYRLDEFSVASRRRCCACKVVVLLMRDDV